MKRVLGSILLGATLLYSSSCTGTGVSTGESGYPKETVFSKNVLDTLRSAYDGMNMENLLCLEGVETLDMFVVDDVYQANVASSDSVTVNASCKDTERYDEEVYLGTVHNHPVSQECRLSGTDKAWFYMGSREKVYGVVCHADEDQDRLEMLVRSKPYNWYNKNNKDTTQISRSIITYGDYYK